MLIDIDKEHRECMEKAAAFVGLETKFYTVESNEKLLRVEVTVLNTELTNILAFYIGNQFRGELEKMWLKKYQIID